MFSPSSLHKLLSISKESFRNVASKVFLQIKRLKSIFVYVVKQFGAIGSPVESGGSTNAKLRREGGAKTVQCPQVFIAGQRPPGSRDGDTGLNDSQRKSIVEIGVKVRHLFIVAAAYGKATRVAANNGDFPFVGGRAGWWFDAAALEIDVVESGVVATACQIRNVTVN